MARRRKKSSIPRILILILIITGIATLILRMLGRRLQVVELGEIAGYVGTAFAISLLIIIGILVVNLINRK